MPRSAHATRRAAPAIPRRVSGPTRRLAPVGAPASRTGAFERISRIPDHRVVDRVLRSRGCIWLIGIMLGGIVAMQVSLLRLNTGISRAVQTQSTLTLQNADLQSEIAQLSSSERVIAAAAGGEMIDPPAGQVKYLTARPDVDARYAAKRMKPASERAQAIMANGGVVPGSLAPPGSPAAQLAAALNAGTAVAGTTPETATTPQAETATTTPQVDPATTAGTTPTPQVDPATTGGTTTPQVTPEATPVTPTDPVTGAATAPQG